MESILFDAGHGRRNANAYQRAASIERIFFDAGHGGKCRGAPRISAFSLLNIFSFVLLPPTCSITPQQLLATHRCKTRQCNCHAHGGPQVHRPLVHERGRSRRKRFREKEISKTNSCAVQWRPATEDGSQWRVQMCGAAMLGVLTLSAEGI